MEIAVIGSGEFIIGFRLAGVRKIYPAENEESLRRHITKVLNDNEVGILVMNSQDMDQLSPRLRTTLENSIRPTVITIGGGEGEMSMRERIKRSVGVDLWK
ncbi:MAG: V-type ATP synthase subunit F [Methanomicrobiales archaeon]|nr:V-type ATP synthase subunit F [Methanomicrobiales archaeon]